MADWILRAVARVIWFIDSLHQGLVWTVLLAILAYLTLRLGARARAVRTAPRPSVAPQPSELASLAGTIRRAGMSPSARHELAGRLRGIAVELRTQREAIPTQRAWEELEDGTWPPHPALAAVLRPRDSRTPPLQRGDHLRQIDRAVNALWNYAQGGEFDDR
ncbi:hypothetical protein H5T55_00860 [Candidatus Bipolaricaulota bacterium]|nr:hypothetical protein [Candidatus Bipolaricaulota bacterium]